MNVMKELEYHVHGYIQSKGIQSKSYRKCVRGIIDKGSKKRRECVSV